jgi:hypothetical protein
MLLLHNVKVTKLFLILDEAEKEMGLKRKKDEEDSLQKNKVAKKSTAEILWRKWLR